MNTNIVYTQKLIASLAIVYWFLLWGRSGGILENTVTDNHFAVDMYEWKLLVLQVLLSFSISHSTYQLPRHK